MKSISVRWGVLGAGRIAQQFADGIGASQTGMLAAVASTDTGRARALAATHGAAAHGDYAALLADPDVDAVYIATLHPAHLELILAAAAAGKHILCEKPLTVTAAEAEQAADAAQAAGVALVEAMMYRFQPQTDRLRTLLAEGAVGRPLHIDVSCAFATAFDPRDRLFDPAAGGGAILDVGCYAMSYARMVAGWTLEDDGVEATFVSAGGHLAETGVDDWAVASLVFAGGFTASVRTGTRLADSSEAVIHGSAGHVRVPNPWVPGKDGDMAELVVERVGGSGPQVYACETAPLFGAEIDGLAAAVEHGEARTISLRDSIATARALDEWRARVAASERSS